MHMISFDSGADYVLEDEAVQLRPLTLEDLPHLLPFSVHEPEIWRFSLVQAGGGESRLRSYLQLALEGRASEKEYPFIVFDKRTGRYAGSTRFYDIQPANRSLQLGYTWYGNDFQGTGLNKHCKYLLLQFAFETLGMERVEFRANSQNARSIAAMKSIGCVVEGVLRSNILCADGSRRDSIVLSILKDEWKKEVKAALTEKIKKL